MSEKMWFVTEMGQATGVYRPVVHFGEKPTERVNRKFLRAPVEIAPEHAALTVEQLQAIYGGDT